MQKFWNYSRLAPESAAPAPLATYTVYNAGTLVLATTYSDNNDPPTPKANPNTCDASGYFSWYAADGRYDVRLSGGGIVTPFTWGDVYLQDNGSDPFTIGERLDFTGPDSGVNNRNWALTINDAAYGGFNIWASQAAGDDPVDESWQIAAAFDNNGNLIMGPVPDLADADWADRQIILRTSNVNGIRSKIRLAVGQDIAYGDMYFQRSDLTFRMGMQNADRVIMGPNVDKNTTGQLVFIGDAASYTIGPAGGGTGSRALCVGRGRNTDVIVFNTADGTEIALQARTGLVSLASNSNHSLWLGANGTNYVELGPGGKFVVPRLTTAARTALTATNGTVVYDTSLEKFYGYENSAWVVLI